MFSPHSARTAFPVAKAFARKVGERGWIGMTWPKQYGGHERSHLERYVVIEEMLAHRAPTRSFSTADRQSGPMILRYGQPEIKETILPRIASGELCFCIGLSEPNSGSDVFAASTRATKTDGGWLVNGRKIWTSNAHNSDYMIALLRTSPPTGDSTPDSNDDRFEEALRHTTLIAPKVTIQGGTREVLRGIIARGLGLR
jgi:alkylation response protein AidB-like acyl-CoA dehydrogenase